MLRPAPMARALIVGPRDALETVVNTLYDLKLLHIVDHVAGKEELEIGKPLPQATQASEILVKLRSIASALQIEEPKSTAPLEPLTGDVREKVLALELNISEEDATRKKVQALLQDLSSKIEELTPFAQLPLAFEDYSGYDNLEILAGKAPREITGMEKAAPSSEFMTFSVPGFLVVFVAKTSAPAMRDYLGQQGFTSAPIPEGKGHPRDALTESLAEKEKWEKRLGEIDERLSTLRERYAAFLASAKVHLEVQVEKAEAPLRFAVTDHTFIVEGWVPEETFPKLKEQLGKLPDLFVSELESGEAHSEKEHDDPSPEPPVLLTNPKPIRPFEMLVNMFGTPSYHEIDPTLVFSLAFPMFFGIMVGDAGYGLLWMAYGIWLLRRWKSRPWDFWKNLLVAFIWGGFWATVFGVFVFAEAFGVPFHAPIGALPGTPEFFNWSDNVLHLGIPIYPLLEKLHQVPDFIILSVSVAALHLGAGFVIGVFDDIRHSVKHALGKVGWLLILIAIYVVIIVRAARWPVVDGSVPWGYAIWNGPLAWFPRSGIAMDSVGFTAANPIPMATIYMLVVGIALVLVAEGGLHLMEIFGLLANVISYARLAGIGVAEEAVIFALNGIALQYFVLPGSIVGIVIGIVIMGFSNLLIFLLATISGTIQGVRLNYVEFFLKFYKGSGMLFRPFGERAKSEV